MSITTRLWSKANLASLGKDLQLTTVFMNVKTFSLEEIKHYPYHLRKTYIAYFEGIDDSEAGIEFYATDDEMANWYLSQEYTIKPLRLERRIATFKKVLIT